MSALPTHRIGTTDIEVTRLGLGAAPLGGVGDRLNDAQSNAVVEAAWQSGIRYFDTAPLYGHGLSEQRLGQILRHKPRDEYVLSSKVGRVLHAEGTRDPMMRDTQGLGIIYDYSADGAKRSIESSLERLGLDRLDIVFCHDIDKWTHGDAQPQIFEQAIAGILPALQKLREEGQIRAFGLGVNEWEVCAAILERFDVDCFLLAGRFTLLEQAPLAEFLPACVERDVSLVIGGPYNSGLLANAERSRATYDYKPVDDVRWNKAQRLREVCGHHGVDLRAAALQYPLHHTSVASVIPGAWRTREVDENLEFLTIDIPTQLWQDLDQEGLAPQFW